jgi:tripartite-type tricarboxylate transporter receptor subunit TctC
MNRRNALALLGTLPFASTASSQENWPTKPVRIVVPFGPGGSGDIVSRILAHELEKVAGQPFIVDNKPGATAMVGTAIVKNAPADGYTLLHGSTSSLAANPSLYKQMTYDPDDFTTVAIDGTIPCFMLVAKDAPYKTVKEFVAHAKARKEPLFSGYGNTSSRIPSALFAEQSSVKLEEVAYKDAVPAIQDLIGGRIQVTFPDIVIGESYVRTGQVRALAVTSPQRAPQYPDLEAMAETFPGFEVIAFLSFTVRKEVSAEIQRKLNRWVMEALHKPEVHKRLLEIGITPPPRDWDIARSDAFVKRERELWTRYIKLAKIEPQ